ncbi:MAG: GntR family transcriptional regulator [Chloroflexi bacterium]|nr:MAG: GntR family transcriptional regulator [Chloroflexota bacterium]MBA4376645.1 GntR family transcriptional regulator [Anaerolinea sp.]
MNGTINFESHIPYYIQLMDILKEKVQQKNWLPGDQIPGEQDLCELYKVSRTVVRQALRELELEGVVNRRKGKGTFISLPKINEGLVQKLTGFYQDMVERGFKPVTKVLHQTVIPSNEKVARFLSIKPGEKVIDIQRLRFINEEPIQLVTTYIPFEVCPALANVDLTNRSLYEYLEKERGVFIAKGRRYIEAVLANETEAALLGIDRGDPLLMLDSISFSENGLPVEYYHALHRGDRTRFEVELLRLRETDSKTVELGPNFSGAPKILSKDEVS